MMGLLHVRLDAADSTGARDILARNGLVTACCAELSWKARLTKSRRLISYCMPSIVPRRLLADVCILHGYQMNDAQMDVLGI